VHLPFLSSYPYEPNPDELSKNNKSPREKISRTEPGCIYHFFLPIPMNLIRKSRLKITKAPEKKSLGLNQGASTISFFLSL